MTKQCPSCGQEINETARYCPVCGSTTPYGIMLKNSVPEQIELAAQETASGAEMSTGNGQERDPLVITPANEQVFTKLSTGHRKKRFLILLTCLVALVIVQCIKGTSKTENQLPGTLDIESSDLPENHLETEAMRESALEESHSMAKSSGESALEDSQAVAESTIEESQTIPESTLEESQAIPNHRYEFIIKDCTWTEAFTEAALKGGYLVHFDTSEEYSAIKQELGPYENIKFWIGGCRAGDSKEYHWINANGTAGQEILNSDTYSVHWMQNEPSFKDENLGLDEYYMNIFFYKKENRWVWNDVPDDIIEVMPNYAGKVGYIIEYNQ